jgi:3-methyladenine DNA glycosylase AlkD
MLDEVKQELRKQGDPKKAEFYPKYFKAEHSSSDKFLGVTIPKQRTIAKDYYARLTLDDTIELLHGEWHDERLTALFILVLLFQAGDAATKEKIVKIYLANTKWVNNWDLVDSSAYSLLGVWLLDKDRAILYQLTKSSSLWERRIAIITTMAFIRKGETEDTFKIAQLLLIDKEDYIHKAVGWLLREAGKKNESGLKLFLDKNAAVMPRTMLRYAIERLSPDIKQYYLHLK